MNGSTDKTYNLVRTSFIWPRTLEPQVLDYGYNSLGAYSVLLGRLLYLRHKNEITTHFPGHIADKIDDYFGKRSMEPDIWQEPVIRPSVFQLPESTMFKGTVYVESRKKYKVLSHAVRISSLEHKDATEERKKKAFRFMHFKCDCETHNYQLYRTVPLPKRSRDEKGVIIDNRIASDNPPPIIEMVMCPHALAAFNYLIEEKGCESFDINDRTDKIIQFEITNVLDRKLPFYKLNEYLMEQTFLLKQFESWSKKKN